MKTLLITTILFFSFSSLSQKVKVKNDLVTLDGTAMFKMISSNYPDAFTFFNLEDEKLAIFNANYYRDPQQITAGNPEGRVAYYDITFFNEDLDKCEIQIVGFKKHLAERIINEKLFEDGKLNETAIKQFCAINGSKFSKQRENSSGTTIIINNR